MTKPYFAVDLQSLFMRAARKASTSLVYTVGMKYLSFQFVEAYYLGTNPNPAFY